MDAQNIVAFLLSLQYHCDEIEESVHRRDTVASKDVCQKLSELLLALRSMRSNLCNKSNLLLI